MQYRDSTHYQKDPKKARIKGIRVKFTTDANLFEIIDIRCMIFVIGDAC